MNNFLIVGYGGHVHKNLIPAFKRSKKVEISGFITRKLPKEPTDVPFYTIDNVLPQNIKNIYIASNTDSHYLLAKKFLLLGYNVLCEKPVCLSRYQLLDLIKISKTKKLKLQEVCIYTNHIQFQALRNILLENAGRIRNIRTEFSIPHLEKSNSKYDLSKGGGALFDVGYYPLSIILNLYKNAKVKSLKLNKEKGYEVDTSGHCKWELAEFNADSYWSIGKPYQNYIEIETDQSKIFFDRIFSKPHDFESTYTLNCAGEETVKRIGKDDHFVKIIENFCTNPWQDEDYETELALTKIFEKRKSFLNII